MKEPRRQVYFRRVGLFLPKPSPVLANVTSMLCRVSFTPERTVTSSNKSVYAYDVPGTHNVGLPIQYRFNVGPASQPIAVSMSVNRIRRWPNIETELGDCPLFALTTTDALSPERSLPG